MITNERKAELTSFGYIIEDMGAVHGPEFAGRYRWLQTVGEDGDGFGTEQYSEDEAWADCSQFEVGYLAFLVEHDIDL